MPSDHFSTQLPILGKANSARLSLWVLAAIVLVAIAGRLIFSFGVARGLMGIEPQNESTDGYHLIAENLYKGNGYRFQPDGPLTIQRAPGYPAFLLGIFSVAGIDYSWVQIAQAFLAAVNCLFLFLLGRWIHSASLGLIAASMYAVYPNAIIYSARLYSENLYYPLFLAFAYFLCRASIEGSVRRGFLAGVMWGAGLLTRGTLLPLPIVMPIGVLISLAHRSPKQWIRWALPALLAGILVVTPWTLRNHSISGAIVPVSSWSWAPLYSGAKVAQQMVGWKDLSATDRAAAVEVRSLAQQRFGYAPDKSPLGDPTDELRHDSIAKELTIAEWKKTPVAVVGQTLAGVVLTWFLTFDSGTRLTSLAIHLPLLLLFVGGTILFARIDRVAFTRAWPALALVLFVNAFHAFAYPHVRYMSPAIVLSFVFSALPLTLLVRKLIGERLPAVSVLFIVKR